MQLRVLVATLASAGLFTACGGSSDEAGSGGSGGNGNSGGGAAPSLSLSGVVASGAALPGAAVTVQCATGSGSATAGSDGRYSISVSGGALPCVLTGGGSGKTYHSVAPAGTTVANITPLTELLVAQLTGQDPATFASGASAATIGSTVTAAAVASAQSTLQGTLSAAGIDTAAITSFVSTPLVAATAGSGGNSHDQLLDALGAQITSAGTTLAALTATVATSAAAAAGGASSAPENEGSSATRLLPSELLLAPKAANCATLASGSYRIVKLAPSVTTGGADAVTAVETATLDAATLTWSQGSERWTWAANGNCRYSSADGADIVVAPSGVIVARALIGSDDGSVNSAARGSYRLAIGLPVQHHTVSEFAGTWNVMDTAVEAGAYASSSVTAVFGGDGRMSSLLCADSEVTGSTGCSTSTSLLPVVTAHADGGFELASSDPAEPWRDRLFLFRSGTGDLMGLSLSPDGSWLLMTRQRTLSLPAVGDTSANWSLLANAAGIAQAVTGNAHVIASVNSSAGSYTRNTTDQGSAVSVTQTLAQNTPRDGYTHRLAASVTASDGSTQTVREGWFLGLKNMGLTAIYLPQSNSGSNSNARFGLSVQQP